MFSHVIKVYRSCGLKPAIKTILHDMKAGTLKRKQRLFYQCSSFSAKQRENTVVLGLSNSKDRQCQAAYGYDVRA